MRARRFLLGLCITLLFLVAITAPPSLHSAPLPPNALKTHPASPHLVPGTWTPLGAGLNNIVNTLTVSGTDIYVGGRFLDAGGDPNADFIAKYGGGVWSALGDGLSRRVHAIVVDGSVVYAGGLFINAGGDPAADYLAKFENGTWSAYGMGLNGNVNALLLDGETMYVGGDFTDAGGVAEADYIAKYQNGSWSALGGGLNQAVLALARDGNKLYAGGSFMNAGGDPNADRIAKFSGGTWSAVTTDPPSNPVYAVAVDGADVYIGTPSNDGSGIYKLNGGARLGVGSGLNATVLSILLHGSDIYAAGLFTGAGGDASADHVARFSSGKWSALGTGLDDDVKSLAFMGNSLIAGGDFLDAGGDSNADHIAQFTAATAPCTAKPSKPILVEPADKSHVTHPAVLLDWGDTACAVTYSVMVRRKSKTGPLVYQADGLTASQTETGALSTGRTYFWRVRALNSFGVTRSAWSKFVLK